MALKKQCRCGSKISIEDRCCNKCIAFYQDKDKQRYRLYDEKKRDKEAHSFYLSPEWKSLREVILTRYGYIDLYVYYTKGIAQRADTVHHIVEISESSERKLDESNLFPLSRSTHEKIHRMYKKDKIATQMMLFNLLERWGKEMKG